MTNERFKLWTVYDELGRHVVEWGVIDTSIVPKSEVELYEGIEIGWENFFSEEEVVELLNNYELKLKKKEKKLKECKKTKSKRLNKIRKHRAVIEEMGGTVLSYKSKLAKVNGQLDQIKELIEDGGALTKRQLYDILKNK